MNQAQFNAYVDKVIDGLLDREKGYVNDPTDRGGETNHGITVKVARRNGWTGPMISMPRSFARNIYYKRFIAEPGFDKVGMLAPVLAEELIDTGVNMGPGHPSLMLQRWLNAFNDGEKRYEDLLPDGRIGEATIGALSEFLDHRGAEGEAVLAMACNSTQGNRYLEIVESDPSQERFAYGWMRTRVLNIVELLKP